MKIDGNALENGTELSSFSGETMIISEGEVNFQKRILGPGNHFH